MGRGKRMRGDERRIGGQREGKRRKMEKDREGNREHEGKRRGREIREMN
jgi:hypothetical protein